MSECWWWCYIVPTLCYYHSDSSRRRRRHGNCLLLFWVAAALLAWRRLGMQGPRTTFAVASLTWLLLFLMAGIIDILSLRLEQWLLYALGVHIVWLQDAPCLLTRVMDDDKRPTERSVVIHRRRWCVVIVSSHEQLLSSGGMSASRCGNSYPLVESIYSPRPIHVWTICAVRVCCFVGRPTESRFVMCAVE